MSEVIYGEAIRRIRIEKGLTQERLAEGICSPSSLSRIENGGQVPSRKTFQLLMERLDGPGYSYAHFLSEEEYHKEILKDKILEALEEENYETARDILGDFYQLLDESDIKSRQFFEMSKLICFDMWVNEKEYYAKRCVEILRLGRPNWDVEGEFSQYEADIRVEQGRIDVRKKDWVEIWVVNNLAVGYLWQQEYQKALEIFVSLCPLLGGDEFLRRRSWKSQAVICNNIAICLLKMNKPYEAREYLTKASINVRKEGGITLLFQLLKTKMAILKVLGDTDAYEQEKFLVNQAFRLLPNSSFKKREGDHDFYREKELLII